MNSGLSERRFVFISSPQHPIACVASPLGNEMYDKYMKFKSLSAFFTCLLLTIPLSTAYAGELVTPNVTVSWDDSSLYIPAQLEGKVLFTISGLTSQVYRLDFDVVNKFGDKISICYSAYPPINSHSCAIFNNSDYSGTKLNLTVINKNFSSSVYQSPLTFLDRYTKPISQPKETIAINDDLEGLKEQIRVLKAKINKICKSKPKPKGC